MFHTVAFSQNNTSVNVGGLVTPVVDPTVTINGNNLLVPDKVNQVVAAVAWNTNAGALTKAQLQSPSLREVFFPSLTPLILQATPDSVPFVYECQDTPIPLSTNEGLNYFSNATNATSTGQQGALVFLGDGPIQPIAKSKVFTMRFTTAIQQAVNVWVSGAMTLDQTLPVGNYDVVGMRVEAAGLLAARLIFIGASAVVRPGCPGNASDATNDLYSFRMGRMGVWGSFYSLTPPSLEVLGGTAASQTGYIDLVPR